MFAKKYEDFPVSIILYKKQMDPYLKYVLKLHPSIDFTCINKLSAPDIRKKNRSAFRTECIPAEHLIFTAVLASVCQFMYSNYLARLALLLASILCLHLKNILPFEIYIYNHCNFKRIDGNCTAVSFVMSHLQCVTRNTTVDSFSISKTKSNRNTIRRQEPNSRADFFDEDSNLFIFQNRNNAYD